MPIFSDDDDRHAYLHLMNQEAERIGVSFLAWALMDNHVHLIAVPESEDALARAIGEAHRRYTLIKNRIEGVSGYLFQGRFASCVLDEGHLLAAGRYVENNPVKAGIVKSAAEHPWSSARYHLGHRDHDPLIRHARLPQMVESWASFIGSIDEQSEDNIIKGTRTGRPVGNERFVLKIEGLTGRSLRPGPPGRPRKTSKLE